MELSTTVIEQLDAGDVIDALVCEQFLGVRWSEHRPTCLLSTDERNALAALKRWRGDYDIRRQNGRFRVTLYQPSREYEAWAATLPLAICRAALYAVRNSDPRDLPAAQVHNGHSQERPG